MYGEICDIISNNLEAIEPLPQLAFSFGCFTLIIHLGGWHAAEILIDLLINIWVTTAPVTFALAYFSFAVTIYMVLAIEVNPPRGRRRVGG